MATNTQIVSFVHKSICLCCAKFLTAWVIKIVYKFNIIVSKNRAAMAKIIIATLAENL